LLFEHDEEIISQFQSQVDARNDQIANLEEKLRVAYEDCGLVRNQLYDSEIARNNEAQARIAFHRHLQLEQALHLDCSEAYGKTMTKLDTVNTLNGILQEEVQRLEQEKETLKREVENSQHIIESMAKKISNYESGTTEFIKSLKSPPSNTPTVFIDESPQHLGRRSSQKMLW
jgi:SMC interacting uncharacterized protein involved in chromosome segregation